jgi:hypothetical protein
MGKRKSGDKEPVMKIFLNDKLVRQETYKEDAGEVVGIRFSFLGQGLLRYKIAGWKRRKCVCRSYW